MAVRVSYRFKFMYRLVSVFTLHESHGRSIGRFSTFFLRCNKDEGACTFEQSSKLTSRQTLMLRGRRPLCPVERVYRFLPQEALSPELIQLREQNQQQDGDANTYTPVSHCRQKDSGTGGASEKEVKTRITTDGAQTKTFHQVEGQLFSTLPGETFLTFGELLIAEYRKKRRVAFRKMFQLQRGARLQSTWGSILHDDIYRKPSGCFLKTSRGVLIFIRRVSLEDYVLYMKRGPAIVYPKDAAMMLMMMDVTEGNCVLESGSGSGAMSLFLSRAVGLKGSVLSVEVREDHYKRAVSNYNRWRKSWSLCGGQEWPDNVEFHKSDLCAASSLLSGRGISAVSVQFKLSFFCIYLHSPNFRK